ncbi:MAG: hypothetical protein AAFQ81_05670 [Pseudomonadota bacterium]
MSLEAAIATLKPEDATELRRIAGGLRLQAQARLREANELQEAAKEIEAVASRLTDHFRL